MSRLRETLGPGIGAALLALYPEPWRARYREEMLALMEDDPPGPRGLASLLTGAAHAHLRPGASVRAEAGPSSRMRLSIGAMFCCWIAVCLAAVGFQKTTEEPVFTAAGPARALLAIAHDAILAGGLLGAGAIALGGVPLLWQAVATALSRRDRALALLIARPAIALVVLLALVAVLLAIAPARGHGFPAPFVLETLLPWSLGVYALAFVCATTPRAVMRRVEMSPPSLRRASFAGIGLVSAMCLVSAGLALYAPALWLARPSLAAEASGPYGASTGAMLLGQLLAAVLCTALGALAAARACAAARAYRAA